MTKERALDIFEVLNRLDKKDFAYWDNLNDQQRKEFAPLVVQRWLSSTSSAGQIVYLNEIANKYIFKLGNYKKLLYLLLAASTDGQQKRYGYQKTKPSTKKPKSLEVLKQFYNYSTREALRQLPLVSKDDIINMAEQLGYQKDEMSALKKEFT